MAKCVDEAAGGSTDNHSESRVRVVGALVETDGRILLTRRRKEQTHGGYWEFPGGKVEPGESDAHALARELEEELQVVAEVGDYVCTVTHSYSSLSIELAIYRCTIDGQKPVCRDVEAVMWVTPADLEGIALTPPDRVVASLILEKGAR